MFVKLDDVTIMDMMTGTCYQLHVAHGKDEYNEIRITFNGPQRDKFCANEVSLGFWRWLNSAAMKFDEPQV